MGAGLFDEWTEDELENEGPHQEIDDIAIEVHGFEGLQKFKKKLSGIRNRKLTTIQISFLTNPNVRKANAIEMLMLIRPKSQVNGRIHLNDE